MATRHRVSLLWPHTREESVWGQLQLRKERPAKAHCQLSTRKENTSSQRNANEKARGSPGLATNVALTRKQ